METSTILYITQTVTVAFLIWSEYLGLSPQHKSNAIMDLLICGVERMSPRDNSIV